MCNCLIRSPVRVKRHLSSAVPTREVALEAAGDEVLVYIAAFAPDKGESVNTLIANPPPGAPVPPILPPQDGFLYLDREKFPASLAADVSAEQAAFMAASPVPWGVDAMSGTISEPHGGASQAGSTDATLGESRRKIS